MKILVAEDNRFFRCLLEAHLNQWGHEPVICDNGEQAWHHLKLPTGPRIAVLDWDMPKKQGVEVCKELRLLKDHHYVYVILLTAKNTKEELVEGMDSGADDYIVKPFNPFELQVRLRAATRIVQLQEDLMLSLRQAQSRAKRDELTKLWNRSAILESMDKELERSKREHTSLGVIMADVDHFKQVNDTHGHVVGDRILYRIATSIRQSLRVYDSVGRYGGDEFLAVLANCSEAQTLKLAERVRKAVSAEPHFLSGNRIQCTVSLGVTAVTEPDRTDLSAIIRSADQALYDAKAKGRNCAATQPVSSSVSDAPIMGMHG